MHSLLHDLRFAFRVLAKTPGFTGSTVLVLALGIGLNAVVFNLLYAVAFSPRPFPEPDRIVQLHTQDTAEPSSFRAFSLGAFHGLRERTDLFAGVLAQKLTLVAVGDGAATRRALAAIVSSDFFEVLGVPLIRGRTFTADEEKPGVAGQFVIVSYAYWRAAGFDATVMGSSIRINGRSYTVVGVAPQNFNGTMAMLGAEFYFPLGAFDALAGDVSSEHHRSLVHDDVFALLLTARLQAGISAASAAAALEGVAAGLEQIDPHAYRDKRIVIGPLPRGFPDAAPAQDGPVRALALVLLGLAASVLLIVALNLAGLMLARGHARRKEFAVRLALGGTRTRLVRQLLTEGFVLALLGGALGCVGALWVGRMIVTAVASRLPVDIILAKAAPGIVIGATLALSILATLLFALGPALRLSRRELVPDLQHHAGEDAVRHRRGWSPRHPLVVAQIALSLALIIGAGLFSRMITRAVTDDTGIDEDRTLVAEFDASLGGRDRARTLGIFRSVGEQLAAVPGVDAASIAHSTPYSLAGESRSVRRAEAEGPADDRSAPAIDERSWEVPFNAVGADYFAAIGLPLLRGRTFTPFETDHAGAPPVAIIDERLAQLLWPGEDALGRRIAWADPSSEAGGSSQPTPFEVVGITRTAHLEFLQQESPGAIYIPFAQGFVGSVYFLIRSETAGEAALSTLRERVRHALQSVAPDVPFARVQTFREHKEASLELWLLHRISAVAIAFGATAALIALVGLYGTKAYGVSRRTREIGIRLALGAKPSDVRALILGEGLIAGGLGIALGLLLGAALGRVLRSLIPEFGGFDPAVFGLTAFAVLIAALVASWLPARRATKIDPIKALRAD